MKQLIFKLPTELHRSLRMHTAMNNTTIKAFIVDLMQQYLSGDIGDNDLNLNDNTASSKPFTLHVDEALHEQIKLACENKNMSLSKLLVGLVRYGLDGSQKES